MTAANVRTMLWAAAGLVLGAAVVLSVRSLALAPAARERLTRKEGELAGLRRIDGEASACRSAVRAVESLGGERIEATATLPAASAAAAKPDDVRTESRAFGEGWVEVTAAVTFRDAPLRDAMALADLASAQRPPWRLVSCDVRTSSGGTGSGQVTLVLATVRRTPAGGP